VLGSVSLHPTYELRIMTNYLDVETETRFLQETRFLRYRDSVLTKQKQLPKPDSQNQILT